VSNVDPKIAATYGSFVQAAYDMYDADPNNLTPAPLGIPQGYELIAWIQMTDFVLGPTTKYFYGFLVRKELESAFVLALRGTSNVLEWWDSFHAIMVPFKQVPAAGEVADGFARIYDTLEVVPASSGDASSRSAANGDFALQISNLIRSSQAARVTRAAELVVTGHSLGAALCSLYVLDNATNARINTAQVYTFGSPRVGDTKFVRAFDALDLTSWRIVNTPDIIPDLPPKIFGYRHVREKSLIDSTGKVKPTLACAHAIETYLSLLDPANYQTKPACLLTPSRAAVEAPSS
jgi:Lipase (class 3)